MPRYQLIRLLALAAAWMVAGSVAQAALFTNIDFKKEIEIGREAAREFERTNRLSSDKVLLARAKRVGDCLIQQMTYRMFPYEFKVVAGPTVNASAFPGGIIYIWEGLLNRLENDNQLAFVMGHELAHAAQRHYAKREEKSEAVDLLGGFLSGLVGDWRGNIAGLVSGLARLSYSRADENEADEFGLEYAWRAGFDTRGGAEAQQVFIRIEKGKSAPRFLRTHPPAIDRLKHVERVAKRLSTLSRPAAQTAQAATQPSVDLAKAVGDVTAFNIADNPWLSLSAGNEWVYEVQTKQGVSRYKLSVISAVPLSAGSVYRAEISFGGDTSVSCQLLTTAGEVWRRNRPSSADSPWRLEYITAFPSSEPVTRDGWQFAVIGKESVSLPCGSFPEALRVRKQGGAPSVTQDLWLAPGIGVVKRYYQETAVTETLVSYKLKAIGAGVATVGDPKQVGLPTSGTSK